MSGATDLTGLWSPPEDHRLTSVLATTYELDAEFLEEDLLPSALGVSVPSVRRRAFRLSLERSLQDAEVTVFVDVDGYHGGRQTPRIDLVPVPRRRQGASIPKLHAKVTVLQFAPRRRGARIEDHVVRVLVGSANLTAPGYCTNYEVVSRLESGPEGGTEESSLVHGVLGWLDTVLAPVHTDQSRRQLAAARGVVAGRATVKLPEDTVFVGSPQTRLGEAVAGLAAGRRWTRATLVSPFWPGGDTPTDLVDRLGTMLGGLPKTVRLVGPGVERDGRWLPEMPAALAAALKRRGAKVFVAPASPDHGVETKERDVGELTETDAAVEVGRARARERKRKLHAKILVAEGPKASLLAAGSFNHTRRGWGLQSPNTEAGLVWRLEGKARKQLSSVLGFVREADFVEVEGDPSDWVVDPDTRDTTDAADHWPGFLVAVEGGTDWLRVVCDAEGFPEGGLSLTMRDIRGLRSPDHGDAVFTWGLRRSEAETTEGSLDWGRLALPDNALDQLDQPLPKLTDLQLELRWEEGHATVPVRFVEKDALPIVVSGQSPDEQTLIAYFLGLWSETDENGFNHALPPSAPLPGRTALASAHDPSGILSYRIRSFIQALPGVQTALEEVPPSESAVRRALRGPTSPLALGQKALESCLDPADAKSHVAAVFQLAELVGVVRGAQLPELPGGAQETVRGTVLEELEAMLTELDPGAGGTVLEDFARWRTGAEDAQ
jgi:hypothetical protein